MIRPDRDQSIYHNYLVVNKSTLSLIMLVDMLSSFLTKTSEKC
jgi:hypothetical protein